MVMIQLYIMVLLLHTECERGKCLEGGTEMKKNENHQDSQAE